MDYRRTGGLANRSDNLVVTQNGHARLTTRFTTCGAELNAVTRTRLMRALRNANFGQLKSRYEPQHPIPDAFTYVISHAGHTVQAVDTAVPSRLQALVDVLNQIVSTLER